jgi:hypothetical protein
MPENSTTQYSTPCHTNIAQHSTAYYSILQHITAQHTTPHQYSTTYLGQEDAPGAGVGQVDDVVSVVHAAEVHELHSGVCEESVANEVVEPHPPCTEQNKTHSA